jgi:hypothetical protein
VPADFEQSGKRFAGAYVPQRRAYTTLEKLVAFAQPATVSATKAGLVVTTGGRSTLSVPEGPLTFRAKETGGRVEFVEGPGGRIVGLATSSMVLDRVGPLDNAQTLLVLLVVLLLTCAGVLVGAWRRQGRGLGPFSKPARWGAIVVGIASATWLATIGLFLAALPQLVADPFEALPAYPNGALRAAVGAAYAASLLAVAGVALFAGGVRRSGWTLGRTVRHALVLAVMLAAAALLVRWNVLFAPYYLAA